MYTHLHDGTPCTNGNCALPPDPIVVDTNQAPLVTASKISDLLRESSPSTYPTAVERMKAERLRQEAVEAAEVVLRMSTSLDVSSPHGKDTPGRFVDMLKELTTPEPIKWTTFPAEGMDEMITVGKIPFTSVCEHHVIPFIGLAHVGYIPNELLPGLSKIARVVKHFAAGLQVQERLTQQVADYLDEQLKPHGVIVVMDAEHFCMTIRGVQVPGATTRTTAVKGRFKEHDKTAKAEFLAGLNGH